MKKYIFPVSALILMGWADSCKPVSSPFAVTLCKQVWMTSNLDVDKYRNGDPIPKVASSKWDSLTTGAYCYYNNDSATYAATYGKLYNWYAVNDPRGLAPTGWHVPSDAEWTILSNCLGGVGIAGGKMKSTGYWVAPNTGATNSSGFTALPGGVRAYGVFNNIRNIGMWWSSTQSDSTNAWCRSIGSLSSWIIGGPQSPPPSAKRKQGGFSVRCVRDPS